MPHRFFTLRATLAVILFVAVLFAWAQLFLAAQRPAIYVHRPTVRFRIDADWQSIAFAACPPARRDQKLPMITVYDISAEGHSLGWLRSEADAVDGDHWRGNLRAAGVLGFCYLRGAPQGYYRDAALCPTWFIVLLSALPLVPVIWRYGRMRSRWKHRQCTQCGYDLRIATKCCPECGAMVPPAMPATVA